MLLQRLFSTFPAGFPGIGLLLLRLGAGGPILYSAVQDLFAAPDPLEGAVCIATACGGILLCLGLWTPVVGGSAALAELWMFFFHAWAKQVYPRDHVLLGVLCAALVLLGPGAWSVDARLFGRKLFVTRKPARRKSSP